MSQEDMEHSARQLAEGVTTKNLDLVQAASDPVIEFTSRLTAVEGRAYRGHAGWADYLADMNAAWEDFRLTVEDFIRAGPKTLIAIQRVELQARSSGARISQPVIAVQEFRDG